MGKVAFMRKPPMGDEQSDLFVPKLYDVPTKDARSIMDVAVFRLSKRNKRAGEILRYDLPDGGYIEVASGAHGMASIWDYDIVLMMISHLTEQFNAMIKGDRDDLPDRVFRPHVGEILKFCRRSTGGRAYAEVEGALSRLASTTVMVVRRMKRGGEMVRVASGEGLIGPFTVESKERTGRVSEISIGVPNWVYDAVTLSERPEVLTVDPDFFLIDSGVGRFIYRLARSSAGRTYATWGFRTIYGRTGALSEFKEFCRILRDLVKADQLPEYHLIERKGKQGPILVMVHRRWWEKNQDVWNRFVELGGQQVMEAKLAAGMIEEDAYKAALEYLRKKLDVQPSRSLNGSDS